MSADLKPIGLLVSIGIAYITWKIYGFAFAHQFLISFIGGIIVGALVFADY